MKLRPALATLPLLTALALLGGCASPLAGKPADQATRLVLRENLQHASYNFSGEMGFNTLHGSREDDAKPQLRYTIDEVARSTKVTVSGAVDQASKRMELIPSFRFERRNLQASVTLPLELNLQDFSLLVDPSALDLFVPELHSEQPRFVRFQLPPDIAGKIPLDAILQALPGLVDEGYGKVAPQAFALEALDGTARELGASYQLRIAMSPQQENQVLMHVLEGLAKVVSQQAERDGRPQDGKQAEQLLQLVRELTQSKVAKQPLSKSVSHLYANRRGQLLGVNQTVELDTPQLRGQAYIQLRYSNHGKPVFAYQPTAASIIDYDKLPKPQWLKGLEQ
ncbi:hypothetical protein [Aquitalea magnusonii]|uniref:Lipoprotein n=1 Tax=Aquitalea magnusonii TaxID=332411 RepID=A0A318JP37_9NEIS|nr:hypothetical protein [Aquitalea magnusonii]PXX45755.1 hypothetical protein DFR38_111153 [Aquitalea magnusonii]